MAELLDLRVHARRAPDRLAVSTGQERLCFGELEALANRLAAVFRARGLRRGDHVSTLIGNRPEMLALAWAAWRTGLYLTPLPTSLAVPELAYLVRDCEARLVIAEGAFATQAAALAGNAGLSSVAWLSWRGAIEGFQPIEPALEAASPLPAADEPPGALMMYTSGTTGSPKGVLRPLLPADWRGTPPFAADLLQLFGLQGEDVRYLSTAPLYHAAPLRVALAVTAGGGCVHVMDRFDAERALQLLVEQAITHSQWVPAMFQRLLALPESRRRAFRAPAHRRAIHGAAPCPPELKRAMIDWWGPILLEYYSGSEGVGLTLIDSPDALAHPGSVGRARKGEIHIVDDAGQELPPGQTGRIFFSGVAPYEYFKAPAKTAAGTLPNGWQTFGDVGHVDAQGYLYLTDRVDDMIISGGVNIYPQEIEAVIRSVPGVVDCAVVGQPDDAFGERPVAWVEAASGAADSTEALVAAIRQACQERLGRFKQPTDILLTPALPRSPTGKLLRRELRSPQPTPVNPPTLGRSSR